MSTDIHSIPTELLQQIALILFRSLPDFHPETNEASHPTSGLRHLLNMMLTCKEWYRTFDHPALWSSCCRHWLQYSSSQSVFAAYSEDQNSSMMRHRAKLELASWKSAFVRMYLLSKNPNIECLVRYEGHSNYVVSMATDSERLFTGGKDWRIRVWDIRNLNSIRAVPRYTAKLNAHARSLHRSGDYLYSGDENGTLRVFELRYGDWDAELMKCVKIIENAHSAPIYDILCFEEKLITCTAEIKMWDITNKWKELCTLPKKKSISGSLAIAKGLLFSGASDGNIQIWNLETLELITTLCGHKSTVGNLTAAQVRARGLVLFATSDDRTVSMWDTTSLALIHRFEGHTDFVQTCCVLLDKLYTAGADWTIRIWSLNTFEAIATLQDTKAWINVMTIVGDKILTGGGDNLVKVWGPPSLAQPSRAPVEQLLNYSNYSGYLLQKKGLLGLWIKVWVVLKDVCLYFFPKNHTSKPPLEFLTLDNKWTVSEVEEDGLPSLSKKFPFAISLDPRHAPSNSAQASYILAATSEKERNIWVKAITETIFLTSNFGDYSDIRVQEGDEEQFIKYLEDIGIEKGTQQYEELTRLPPEKKQLIVRDYTSRVSTKKEPQYWITVLKGDVAVDGADFVGLLEQLETHTANKKQLMWIRDFIFLGGVSALTEVAENLCWKAQQKGTTNTQDVHNAMVQCLKSDRMDILAPSLSGGNVFGKVDNVADIAAMCLSVANYKVVETSLRILNIIVQAAHGHPLVLEGITNLFTVISSSQEEKSTRFSVITNLINQWNSHEHVLLLASIVRLVHNILLLADEQVETVQLVQEFEKAGWTSILPQLVEMGKKQEAESLLQIVSEHLEALESFKKNTLKSVNTFSIPVAQDNQYIDAEYQVDEIQQPDTYMTYVTSRDTKFVQQAYYAQDLDKNYKEELLQCEEDDHDDIDNPTENQSQYASEYQQYLDIHQEKLKTYQPSQPDNSPILGNSILSVQEGELALLNKKFIKNKWIPIQVTLDQEAIRIVGTDAKLNEQISCGDIRSVIPVHDGVKRDFCFKLILKNENNTNSNNREYILCANDEQEFERWVDAIELKRSVNRDWNREFQQIMEAVNLTQQERSKRLGELVNDFSNVATKIGKIIISELHLANESRTVKCTDTLGGFAGGAKYISHGCLFKFAIDNHQLYEGDEFAMKAASHEMKGLTAYIDFTLTSKFPVKLYFPIMTIIDLYGYRLVAVSILPVGTDTIIYGSPDARQHVFASNSEMNALMKKAARALNLKPHWIYSNSGEHAQIAGPGDIEGHLGRDSRFYVLDTARVFPPTVPSKQGEFLYRLFRREFVRNYSIPLCSDSFSAWGRDPKNITTLNEHNKEIRQAFTHLEHGIIPKLAESLLNFFGSMLGSDGQSLNEQLESDKLMNNENARLMIINMHRQGVNVRYLGNLRKSVLDPTIAPKKLSYINKSTMSTIFSRFILTEMVARIAKNRLRAQLRKLQTPESSQYRTLICLFFADLLSNFGQLTTSSHNETTSAFWNPALRNDLLFAFQESLLESEMNMDAPLEINMKHLFVRVQYICGVNFKGNTYRTLCSDPNHNFTVEELQADLDAVVPKVKELHYVSFFAAQSLHKQASTCKDVHQKLSLLNDAKLQYLDCLEAKTDEPQTLLGLANLLCEIATSANNQTLTEELHTKASYLLLQGLKLNPNNSELLLTYSRFLRDVKKDYGKAMEYIETARKVNPLDKSIEYELSQFPKFFT